ncbi:DUF4383 domain-containing protein [Arthrobacter sp. 4R501]|uniref:DUF4383 domain-containing protein n=1 Tax=Arthrobacter sp. 4R501 TaxID=2058886 RepID=UPI000CE48ECA|nr:DUF4383 domain-containing protein [Arthrobacter sp. 4R501]
MATHTGTRTAARTNVQKASIVVGAVFLLVGILGFVPGITANFDELHFAGHHSEAMLLGLFQVSALHNIVHLLFGAAGLLMAKTATGARSFLLYGGVIYLVLFVYGLVVPQDSAGNFVPLNGFDNVLHLLLGVGMVALAVILTKGHVKARA